MKKIIVSFVLMAFLFFLVGISLLLVSSYIKNSSLMMTGIVFLLLGTIEDAVLMIYGLRYWLKKKSEVSS